MVQFSLGFLHRLSTEVVDPYTVGVEQAAAKQLPLKVGRHNVLDALSHLRCYSLFGDVFRFWFGIKSVGRNLGDTREGLSLLALSAALSGNFGEDFAAEIIHSMVTAIEVLKELVPYVRAWLNLITVC